MPQGTRYSAEQILETLREAEVELAQGQKIPAACKMIGVTDQTCYRWKEEYGGSHLDQAKRLKQLEMEDGHQ